ncbi:MAG TPA: TetR/AcrR family transcriptional regulator [Candidatus Binatia bacterium]|nr:TetR/AcrR family transcriptional regulator [Candidatus Binatia bacterium]
MAVKSPESRRGGAAVRKAGDEAEPKLAVDRIRKTARELFYREGIRAVGVDEIVTRAGVTKPSLYRSFSSKDELAAAYLRDYDGEFWVRFERAAAEHPGDPKQQVLEYLRGLAQRAQRPDYRGCGLSNAALEYPAHDHPARKVAEDHKIRLRQRLTEMAKGMGAAKPEVLADALLLLIEGVFVTGQLFGEGGPAKNAVEIAETMIEASRAR